MKATAQIVFLLVSLPALLSAADLPFERVIPPAGKDALAPNLCSLGDHFALSWIERGSDGVSRLQMARWNGLDFDKKTLVAASDRMFANWADIPSVIEAPCGDLYAHWLDRISTQPYAYGVRIGRSTNGGKQWKSIGWLHDDTSATEHGFVSLIPDDDHLRAFWLDGRAMAQPDGRMALRTAVLEGDQVRDEQILDDNVCTCCPTSAVRTPVGPMVVYRDRSPREIRDTSFVLRNADWWSEPAPVKADHWLMPGCPVNGPSIAAHGSLVAVSRFTVIHHEAQVVLRWFNDGSVQAGREIVLDQNGPVGRCATVCTKDSIYTVWIGLEKDQTVLRLAEVSSTGTIMMRTTLCPIDGGPSSGMPRTLMSGGELWITWAGSNRIHLGRIQVVD